MRLVSVAVVLAFVFAMAAPEVHACPVHSSLPAPHHQNSGSHHKSHCTCPQACCPAGISFSLPTVSGDWTVAFLPTYAPHLASHRQFSPAGGNNLPPPPLAPRPPLVYPFS